MLNIKNIFKNKQLLTFLGFFALMIVFISLFYNSAFAQTGDTQSQYVVPPGGTKACQYRYKQYELIVGGYTVPVEGTYESSKTFEDLPVYNYYYTSCSALNDDNRSYYYEFYKDGTFEMKGNMALMGDTAFMLTSHTAEFGRFDLNNQGERINEKAYLKLTVNSPDVTLMGSAIITGTWDRRISQTGPSVYFNPKTSKLIFKPGYYLSNTSNSYLAKSSLDRENIYFDQYLGDGSGDRMLNNPEAVAYRDGFFYIADKGNNRVAIYNHDNDTFFTLGDESWDWQLEGIAVNNDNDIFLSDSLKDIVIKTKSSGIGWKESRNDHFYNTKLFITGEERIKVDDEESITPEKGSFKDKGYKGVEVNLRGKNGNIDYDPIEGKVLNFQDSATTLFNKHSYNFKGNYYLEVNDYSTWDFNSEDFGIDFWVKFEIDGTKGFQPLFSQTDNFYFGWSNSDGQLASNEDEFIEFNLPYFIDSGGNLRSRMFKETWRPEGDYWYRMALVKNSNKIKIFIDGEQLGSDIEMDGVISDKDTPFIVGGNLVSANSSENTYLSGNIDNFRIIKGVAPWVDNFSPPYYFDNAKDITIKGDDIYIADFGNHRIVKMDKELKTWESLGGFGDGDFRFKYPTDIYHAPPNPLNNNLDYFYIMDSQNRRVVKTDLSNMAKNFKEGSPQYTGTSWFEYPFSDTLDTKDQDLYQDFFDDGVSGWGTRDHSGMPSVSRNWGDIKYPLPNFFDMGDGYLNLHYGAYNSVPSTFCGSNLQDVCSCRQPENYPVAYFNIGHFFANKIYNNRFLKVIIEVKSDNVSAMDLILTRKSNLSITKEISRVNENINLVEEVEGIGNNWSMREVSFEIPERVSADRPTELYLGINSECGDVQINSINLVLSSEEHGIPDAVVYYYDSIDNKESIHYTDLNNSRIVNLIDEDILGGKNAHDDCFGFSYPVDAINVNGMYYVIDSINQDDFSIFSGAKKMAELYSNDQKEDISVKFNEGGVKSLNGPVSAEGILSILNDPYSTSRDLVWVGHDLGPAISKCPVVYNESKSYGQKCHREDWLQGPYIDVGMTYRNIWGQYSRSINCYSISDNGSDQVPVPPSECIDPRFFDSTYDSDDTANMWDWNSELPRCTNYIPEFTQELVCTESWDNCCIGSNCCDAMRPDKDCTGTASCGHTCGNAPPPVTVNDTDLNIASNYNLEGGSDFKIASMLYGNGTKLAQEPPLVEEPTCARDCDDCTGSCYVDGEFTRTRVYNGKCVPAAPCDDEVCDNNPDDDCEYYTYTYDDRNGNCWPRESTTRPCGGTCSDSGDAEGCCEGDCNDSCSIVSTNDHSLDCRQAPSQRLANFKGEQFEVGCCKKWEWRCSASCVPNQNPCLEGYAVRFRPNYKYATVTLKGHTGYEQFYIELFHEQTPAPRDMELFIKLTEEDMEKPYGGDRADEDQILPRLNYYETCGTAGCSMKKTRISEYYKDMLLNTGRLIEGAAHTRCQPGNFEECLDYYMNQEVDLDLEIDKRYTFENVQFGVDQVPVYIKRPNPSCVMGY